MARSFVGAHLAEHGSHGLIDDVRTVVSELATNAIVHAQTTFTVTLQGEPASVLLLVRDGAALLVVRSPVPSMGTSGRGLAIVDRLADRWGVSPDRDGGKSVWVWFGEGRMPDRHDATRP